MSTHWELETEKHIFFWGGIFSNWYSAEIELPLDPSAPKEKFNCVEQYMMAQKAALFGDNATKDKIMATSSPSAQKALGRTVTPFDPDKWAAVARDSVYPAILRKFSDHADLRELLLSTDNKVIVEASPFDKIWGIGMGVLDEGIDDPSNWKGSNWLGEITMRVRDHINNGIDSTFVRQQWK